MRADEDRAGIADAPGEPLGVGGGDFQMFGRDGVDERQRFVEIAHQDDRAEIPPRRAGDLAARQSRQLPSTARSTAPASACVVGDEDRLRAGVVLGLRQQVGGDPVGIAVLVGDDQHLGGAGDHVDADLAEHDALGGGHIGVARADDLGDRLRCSRCRRPRPRPPARRRCGKSRRRRRVSPPRARAD